MEDDLLLYQQTSHDNSFVKEAFAYDVRTLEQTNAAYISKCVIALSQYLVYFRYKYNEKKQFNSEKRRLLDASLFQVITPEILKKYKTKKDARLGIVYSDPVLNKIQEDIDTSHDELYLLEGMDKTISELIASFKRELTRRDNELYQQRHSK